MSEISFKISSGLKNIIGKELITDEYAAVFELVKNSFDANAANVEIIFENISELSKSKITIIDDGKGMNEEDLRNKWLFVAYSAKKEGTEYEADYRNRIKLNNFFAGAKGVGRFSCDRLGRKLKLISVKDESNSKIESLEVDWQEFEDKPLVEFKDVNVVHKTLGYSKSPGTSLEITELRDIWNREKLLKLKRSLAKLINPNQGNDSNNFQIKITAKSELPEDKRTSIKYEKVNGFVTNDVFENLHIKTTSIEVGISENGETITSILQDRGDRIYTIIEKNPFKELHSIKCYLFQLNFKAKLAFKNIMGVRSVEYGSVFMYKNGFRVYPFGEPGEDLLLIDRRKAQGYNRFLGNRDIIGRIEINGEQNELRETTSRDGGLVKTDTYNQLVKFFEEFVLKRLENYVVNIIKWGDERINEDTGEIIHPELLANDVKIQILELITGFIKSNTIIDIDYDKNFLKIIETKQDKSVNKIVRNISRIAEKSNNPDIIKEAEIIGKVITQVKADAARDRVKAEKEEIRRKETEKNLKIEKLKVEFFKKQLAPDTDALVHHIKNNNLSVKTTVQNILEEIKDTNYTQNDLVKDLSFILFHTNKAIKAASIITHVDLSESDSQNIELSSFIKGYLENYQDITSTKRTKITYEHKGGTFKGMLSKTELAIVIDNLEDNSFKWRARNIFVQTVTENKNTFKILFSDDGKGLSSKYLENPKKIFEFRETDSVNGTGLGLYIVQEILGRMGATIDFIGNNLYLSGATFQIEFKR